MKNKKTIIPIAAIVIILALVGTIFYTKKSNVNNVHHASISKRKISINEELNRLNFQETSALIIVYSHLKNKKNTDWNKAYSDVLKYKTTIYKYKKYKFLNYSIKGKNGSYVYLINNKANFTISDYLNKNKSLATIGDNKHEIGKYSLKDIYKYVMSNANAKKAYKTILKNIKVNNKLSVQTENSKSSVNKENKKEDIPGDGGIFAVPAGMHGTWYSADSDNVVSSITFGEHTFSFDNDKSELHYVRPSKFSDILQPDWPEWYKNATKNWREARLNNIHGLNYVMIRGWYQGAGDGSSFALHTENGQPVLVAGGGAGTWTFAVYWRSPELAKKYANKRFKDLYYSDTDSASDDSDDADSNDNSSDPNDDTNNNEVNSNDDSDNNIDDTDY